MENTLKTGFDSYDKRAEVVRIDFCSFERKYIEKRKLGIALQAYDFLNVTH